MTPDSPSKWAPWDLTQFSQPPSAALSYFPESHQWSGISPLSKVILVLGKARNHRAQNLGYRGVESPGWFDVLPKTAQDVRHEPTHWCDETVIHRLPRAAAFWIVWIVSAEECLSFMQNSRQICCSTCSVILNVTVTQYMCSLNGIYCPHWLVQWSHHCSHMCIPVHSPWRPGYMDVMHTILVILTMAGLFPDKPSNTGLFSVSERTILNKIPAMKKW